MTALNFLADADTAATEHTFGCITLDKRIGLVKAAFTHRAFKPPLPHTILSSQTLQIAIQIALTTKAILLMISKQEF